MDRLARIQDPDGPETNRDVRCATDVSRQSVEQCDKAVERRIDGDRVQAVLDERMAGQSRFLQRDVDEAVAIGDCLFHQLEVRAVIETELTRCFVSARREHRSRHAQAGKGGRCRRFAAGTGLRLRATA